MIERLLLRGEMSERSIAKYLILNRGVKLVKGTFKVSVCKLKQVKSREIQVQSNPVVVLIEKSKSCQANISVSLVRK